ncbi:MAG: chitobiase/beta-hexosaminidase C-terminal domain-containing protein [Acidobacteriaceae bacterium]
MASEELPARQRLDERQQFNSVRQLWRPWAIRNARNSRPRQYSGGRYYAATWRDGSGNLWLFGGGAFDANGRQRLINDLWEYTLAGTPIAQPPALTTSPTFSLAAATYTSAQTLTISDQTSGSTIYYTTNGIAPNASSTIYSTPISVSSSETVQAVGVASGYAVSSIASAAYAINLPPAATPTFTLETSPPSLTVVSGSDGTVSLTVTPQNGFDSPVSFACSGLPAGATCSFSPATVTPSGGAATAQLTISADAQSAASRSDSGPLFPMTAVAATLFLFGWRKRRGTPLLILAVLGLIGLGFTFGCGSGTGSSGSGSSPPLVTSTVTVTASSGAIQQTVPIFLTVN